MSEESPSTSSTDDTGETEQDISMYRLLGKAAIALALGVVIAYVNPISAADQNAPPVPPKQAEGPAPEPLPKEELMKPMKPIERANMAPKGTLKNPYTDNPEAIAQGKKL